MTKNLAMIDSLKGCINGIKCDQSTEWDRYYEETNYSEKAFKSKIDEIIIFTVKIPNNGKLVGINEKLILISTR